MNRQRAIRWITGIAFVLLTLTGVVLLQIESTREALAARRADEAIERLNLLEKLLPYSPEIRLLQAQASRRLGRNRDVRRYLQQAVELGAARDAVQREEWLALAQSGHMTKAEPHLQELLLNENDDARDICEAFVNGYMRTYRFHDALRMLDAWEKDYPDDALPLFTRGLIFEHLGRDADAEALFSAAIALQPTYSEAFLHRATTRLSMNHPQAAEQDFLVAEQSGKLQRRAWLGRAECQISQANFGAAEASVSRLLKQYPADPVVQKLAGRLALDQGRVDEAVAGLKLAYQALPYDAETCYLLGRGLRLQGLHDEAEELLRVAAEADAAFRRIRSLKDQLHLEPGNLEARYELGMLLTQYESGSDGAILLTGVLLESPHHAGAHRALADYYTRQQQPDLAARHRRAAESQTE